MLAAAAVGRTFGVSDEDISDALAQYVPTNNRSQLVETADNRLLGDAYNANPTSMKASLDNFCRMKEERKMVILGWEHIRMMNIRKWWTFWLKPVSDMSGWLAVNLSRPVIRSAPLMMLSR